jgi:hypothetical protein
MVANMIFLNEYNEPRELSVIDTSTARLRSLFSTTGGFRFWWGINAAGFGFGGGLTPPDSVFPLRRSLTTSRW